MFRKCANDSTYRKGCRCSACREVNAYYRKQQRMNKAKVANGIRVDSQLVDAGPAIQALANAKKQKVTQTEISRVTGITQATVSAIALGKRPRVTTYVHDQILKFYGGDYPTTRSIAERQHVPWSDYEWKVKALLAQGWTYEHMRERLREGGQRYQFMRRGLPINSGGIEYCTAEAIEWLVNDIGDDLGPSTSNFKRMRSRGIYPLIHYTEEGKLIRRSIPELNKPSGKGVKSNHDAAPSRGHRSAA